MGKLFTAQILLLFLLWGHVAMGQEQTEFTDISQEDPNLDALYQRGAYLVYDCYSKHWVCTQELEYKRCMNDRKEALLDFKEQLPCAYLDKFTLEKDCFQRQQELTDRGHQTQFCFHPSNNANTFNF